MNDSYIAPIVVTMFGVDPSCLGGISTLTRLLTHKLGHRSDVDFQYIVTSNQGSSFEKIVCFARAIRSARIRFKQVNGICHVHMADNASVVRACLIIRLARKYDQKVYLHIHCDLSKIRSASNERMKRMIDWAIISSDRVIALGDYLSDLFHELDYPLTQVKILPNAVDCPSENPFDLDRSKVLFLGNVSEAKGVLDILDAIALIDSNLENGIVFELCGRDHIDVQKEIDSRQLAKRVKYRGIVKPDQRFFSQYLLNVLPSHHEAMPFSLLEASVNGIPSIASRVGSIPEIIEDGVSGWLVQPHDPRALSKVLLAVLSQKNRILEASRSVFASTREAYSLDSYIDKLLDIYVERIEP